MTSWIGQQLGPYELEARLGAGGMGVVYRAVHRRLGQARAIKVLPVTLAHDETFVQRFEREARLASELRHPNIVMIFDIAEENGVNYIVMELLDGRSLHDVIRQDGPLPLERAIVLLGQLASALDFAHQRGVVHRDIKPGNALVDSADHLTLVDFGIARAVEGTRLTEASSRIGTAEYMAPESITAGESGSGTDLYALGVIAYEMLTGRVPFTGVNSQTIMYAQIHTPPPPPRSVRTDLDPEVERVVLRQLDKDPARRYATGEAFVRALEGARTGVPQPELGPAYPADSPGPAPTARLDDRAMPGSWAATMPLPAVGVTSPGPSRDPTGRQESAQRTRPPSTPQPSGRASVPPPPTPPAGESVAPAPSGVQRALQASRLGTATIYKLVFGVVVLALLLMTFLPTPRDPLRPSSSDRLAFPLGPVGEYALGADQLGRDVLSRLMVGGRYLVLRLCIVGVLLTGASLLLRRQVRKRTGKGWPAVSAIVLLVAVGMALSVLIELAFGFFGAPGFLQYLGPVGRILLGAPHPPPSSSWGGMLADGRALGVQAPWLPIFPAVGLALVATGLVLLGSAIAEIVKQHSRTAEPALSRPE
jgi:serine/threonine-protein kinase